LARENVLGDDIDILPMTTVERFKELKQKIKHWKTASKFCHFYNKRAFKFSSS
jgi:hypothetical protein